MREARTRRRWVRWLVLAVAGLVVVGAALVVWLWLTGRASVPVLDDAARAEVTQRVQQEVAGRLGIEPSDVAVDLGPGAILPQLDRRRIDEATIEIRLPADRATALIAGATGFDPAMLTLGDGTLRLQLEIDVMITRLAVGIGFAVSAVDGDIVFVPSEFVLAGNPVPLPDLLDTPVVGDWVAPLVEPRTFCVADLLPTSLELTGVKVTPRRIELTVTGHDIPLDETALSTTGVCS